MNSSPLRTGRLARWPRLQKTAGWIRRLYNPSLRQIHKIHQQNPDDLLQPYADTGLDRHPALFDFARKALSDLHDPLILSFGCSTGEEPVTLSRYLPGAHIDGIDINPRSVARAQALVGKAGAQRVTITHAANPPALPGVYDAVFCLSVLRHGYLEAARPLDCGSILPFARFAETVAKLDYALRPGGLMFIWGSNFRFEDSAVSVRYQPVVVPAALPHAGVVYGADNQRLDQDGNSQFVFRKLHD